MTVAEHLIGCLGEEGVEIAKDVFKANRFGPHDVNILDPTGPDNMQRIVNELNDLLAVADMLVERGILPADWQNKEQQDEKKRRVLHFMDYAAAHGALHGHVINNRSTEPIPG